ncbi:MAG: hypothetical protein WC707_05760 [Candidatus Babeliaceae bacterium]
MERIKKFFLLYMLVTCFLNNSISMAANKKVYNGPLKILVLIIASDQYPIYTELQKVWRSYMHDDPEHVEAYFIREDPTLATDYCIEGDIIWAKATEGWAPESSGMIDKTLLSLEAMLPRLSEFDYVLRTNLSSFYVFPQLLTYLETLPRTNCYAGSPYGRLHYASGCGFIMSPDVVRLLVDHKKEFINNKQWAEDVLIGKFMIKHGIKRLPHVRVDLENVQVLHAMQGKIPAQAFHFRIKNRYHDRRLVEDIYIHKQLLKMFYDKE